MSNTNDRPITPRRGSSRGAPTGSRPIERPFGVMAGTRGEFSRRPNMTIDTNIAWQARHETKAQAPWASPADFIPRSSGFTPRSGSPQRSYGSYQSLPSLGGSSRYGITSAKRDGFRDAGVEAALFSASINSSLPDLPAHPQAKILDSFDRLPGESQTLKPRPSTSDSNFKGDARSPARGLVRGLTGLGKKVLKRVSSSPVKIDSPRYTLIPNLDGRIPLLTLEHERYLEIREPLQSGPLVRARKTLQAFRGAFTRDPPELQFPRGQAQVDIVAGYLMKPCSTRLEGSMTTHFVRHSDDSLRAWAAVTSPRDDPSPSTQAERWNMVEARRRVRHQAKLVEEFNESWDAWVSEQSEEIQKAARRDPSGEKVQGGTRAPFRDYYHYMLIAADGELMQRKDIAEALILQYAYCFPGFMRSSE
ncbi:hypothetical protein ANO14919_026990 [Xylariales sp. No.14919]|nr:hypothetical protein ANO14919_026990 [Xylariales sp. No.14919]